MTGMNLQFGGRTVPGFGLGAPDVVGPGIAALQAAVAQYGGPGITNPSGAVAGLQAAGNAAVGVVGPAIDAMSGGSPDIMKMTQWAWQQNGKLATVNSSGAATQADVDAAKAIVGQMITFYQQASRLAASLPTSASGSTPIPVSGGNRSSQVPTTTPPTDSTVPVPSPWPTLLAIGGAVVVVVGGVAVAVARSRAA